MMHRSRLASVVLLAVGACVLGMGAAPPTFPSDPFLAAVRSVESSGNDQAVSRCGATGPFQFMPATWADHARGVPFSKATDYQEARTVAGRYFRWLDSTITRWQGAQATDAQILAAWNGGIGRLRRCGYDVAKMPAESREFARRVLDHIR